ncbi:MAG TPA: YkvA family protein, partial [Geminicoccaceae bacterium]
RALRGCARDPRVPWPAKLLALIVVAYALSPIDLIPDVIPVIGHLDDLILVPLGIALVIRLIPPEVLEEHRRAASTSAAPGSRLGPVLVILVWLVLTLLLVAGALALIGK